MPHQPTHDLQRIARERFKYDTLRPAQEQIIRLVLDKKDVLAVMPTGAGKSAIYQIAGLLLGGATVIVSPLIALQKDQKESIEEKGIAPVAVVNSNASAGEKQQVMDSLDEGQLEFLFMAPEQFANPATLKRLKDSHISLFVVDEAHCITEWGNDFRPDYVRLRAVIEELGRPIILALTATASPQARQDITARLGLHDPKVVVTGFDRPNISLEVEKCPDEEIKQRVLIDRVQKAAKPGIVYVATRKNAEEVALLLRENNVKAIHYHGGMRAEERRKVQDDFMSDDQTVMVATNAFGMGVDKPDIRFVFHYDIPDSPDAYYQEIGRAGRDGQSAEALLLFRPADVGRRRAMASQGKISEEDVEQVVEAIESFGGRVDSDLLAEEVDLSASKVEQVVNRLEDAGALTVSAAGDVTCKSTREVMVAKAAEDQEDFRRQRLARVEYMRDYAEASECRRQYLLRYFGEILAEPCGHCDTCRAGVAQEHARKSSALPFPLKSRVDHRKLGPGTVLRYDQDKVVVLFDKGGERSLVMQVVIDNNLMQSGEGPSLRSRTADATVAPRRSKAKR